MILALNRDPESDFQPLGDSVSGFGASKKWNHNTEIYFFTIGGTEKDGSGGSHHPLKGEETDNHQRLPCHCHQGWVRLRADFERRGLRGRVGRPHGAAGTLFSAVVRFNGIDMTWVQFPLGVTVLFLPAFSPC